MDPIEHIFVDGHLVGHIAQDCGFQAFTRRQPRRNVSDQAEGASGSR